MQQPRYITCAETAKLVRGALKKAFPAVKFGVRSHTYSGGASIDVEWTDGPIVGQVDDVVSPYKGGGFDGMIDLAYSRYAWLSPDGSVTFAKCSGTEGSMGTVPSDEQMQPSFKSELVRFGADFIHTTRRFSDDFYRRAFERACRKWGADPAAFTIVPGGKWGHPYIDRSTDHVVAGHWYMNDLVHQELARRVALAALTPAFSKAPERWTPETARCRAGGTFGT